MMKFKNTKKVIAATLAISTIPLVVNPAQAANTYKDVGQSHIFYDAIENLAKRGVINGYGNGRFGPEDSVTRGQAAKIIARALGLNISNVVNPNYKDVKKTDPFYGAIAALSAKGILTGYQDKSFGANKYITRNEMAVVLTRAFELGESNGATLPFYDTQAYFEPFISAIYHNGITTGATPTTYEGNRTVKRGELAAFVVRAEELLNEVGVRYKITGVSNTQVITSAGRFWLSNDVKAVLNAKNANVLAGAEIEVVVENGYITALKSLVLNARGTAYVPLVLNGGNEIFTGNLTVNADYVEIHNLTITRNLSLTQEVTRDFVLKDATVRGDVLVEDSVSDLVASLNNNSSLPGISSFMDISSLNKIANTTVGPNVRFKNSKANRVKVGRNAATIYSDLKLNELQIIGNVRSIDIQSNVGKLVVDVNLKLVIYGSAAKIDEAIISNAQEVALNLAGTMAKLELNRNTLVSLGYSLSITLLLVPVGERAEVLIENYEYVKYRIANEITIKPEDNEPPIIQSLRISKNNGSDSAVSTGSNNVYSFQANLTDEVDKFTLTFDKNIKLSGDKKVMIILPGATTAVEYGKVSFDGVQTGDQLIITPNAGNKGLGVEEIGVATISMPNTKITSEKGKVLANPEIKLNVMGVPIKKLFEDALALDYKEQPSLKPSEYSVINQNGELVVTRIYDTYEQIIPNTENRVSSITAIGHHLSLMKQANGSTMARVTFGDDSFTWDTATKEWKNTAGETIAEVLKETLTTDSFANGMDQADVFNSLAKGFELVIDGVKLRFITDITPAGAGTYMDAQIEGIRTSKMLELALKSFTNFTANQKAAVSKTGYYYKGLTAAANLSAEQFVIKNVSDTEGTNAHLFLPDAVTEDSITRELTIGKPTGVLSIYGVTLGQAGTTINTTYVDEEALVDNMDTITVTKNATPYYQVFKNKTFYSITMHLKNEPENRIVFYDVIAADAVVPSVAGLLEQAATTNAKISATAEKLAIITALKGNLVFGSQDIAKTTGSVILGPVFEPATFGK